MDAETRTDILALTRLPTILLALAVLAERAAGRSYPVRRLVLCILRPAEAVARDFLGEYMLASFPPNAGLLASGHDRSDAFRLAATFRLLATAIDELVRQTYHCAMATAPGERIAAFVREVGENFTALAASLADLGSIVLREMEPPDTS